MWYNLLEVITMIYLLKGKEVFLLRKQLEKIVALLGVQNDEIINFDCLENSEDELLSELNTPSFFTEHKVVVVKNPYFLTDSRIKTSTVFKCDDLSDYLNNHNPSNTLIFFAEYEKLSSRKNICKILDKVANVFEANNISPSQLFSGVKKACESRSIKINDNTIRYLINLVPNGLEPLINELDKMKHLDQEITTSLLDVIIEKPISQNIFELTDGVAKKDKLQIIKSYADITIKKNQEMTALALLSNQFAIQLMIKKLDLQGYDIAKISKIMNKNPYVIKKNYSVSKTYTLDSITMWNNMCVELDHSIKTGKIDAKIGIDVLITKIIDSI